MPDPDDNKKQKNEFVRALSMVSQIGLMMIACVVIGVLLGNYLDKLLGTSPWLLLVFSFLGVAAAFKSIFDYSKKQR